VGPQTRFGRGGKEEQSLPLPGIDPGCPTRSLVTILTELSRLLHTR